MLLFGRGSGSAHASATQFTLLIGFCVEAVLMVGVMVEVFENHSAQGHSPVAQNFARATTSILITSLLYHQFLIFRNFSIPAHSHNIQQKPASENWARALRSVVEWLLYLVFGVITGEAGYLIALEHFNAYGDPQGGHDMYHAVTRFLNTGETHESLPTTLKALFVKGALGVCILVLVWDILMLISGGCYKSETDRDRYFEKFGFMRLPIWFVLCDLMSFFVWCIVASLVCPACAHWFSGNTEVKFQVLYLTVMVYGLLNLSRFAVGVRHLGAVDSFEEAKKLPL
jgi:hypothetical protein